MSYGPPEARPAVIVTDNVPLYQLGLTTTLGDHYKVMAENRADQALSKARDYQASLAFVGNLQTDQERLALIRGYRRSNLPVIAIIDRSDSDRYLLAAANIGPSCFLRRNCEPKLIIEAAKVATDNFYYLDSKIAPRFVSVIGKSEYETDDNVGVSGEVFSIRELQVLRLVAEGLKNGAIADQLGLASVSVENCISAIYQKLELLLSIKGVDVEAFNMRSVATRFAIEDGLLQQSHPLSAASKI